MGLGLFLARAVIEGVGGSLQIDSVPNEGTEVSVRLPDIAVPERDTTPQRSAEAVAPAVVSKPA
jgi:K+-sensing histidine kinase KdpD